MFFFMIVSLNYLVMTCVPILGQFTEAFLCHSCQHQTRNSIEKAWSSVFVFYQLCIERAWRGTGGFFLISNIELFRREHFSVTKLRQKPGNKREMEKKSLSFFVRPWCFSHMSKICAVHVVRMHIPHLCAWARVLNIKVSWPVEHVHLLNFEVVLKGHPRPDCLLWETFQRCGW